MKIAFLAVLLSVMQAAPPVPRHTPDKSSSSSQDIKDYPAGNKTPSPSPSPAVQQPGETHAQQSGANSPSSPNTQQPIVISKLPTVSVDKDWMDKTAWLFGALLLIVGIAGVCAAVKTLGRIERQALIMERQLALQAAAMRQWVEVTEWTATVDKREDDNSKEFTVGFDIRNPTKLPLIIHKTEVRSFTTTLTNDVRVSIIPEGRHRIWFTFGFNETMQKEYATLNSVSFPIQLTIWLVDAMEKMQDQRLGGLLLYEESSLGKEIVVFIERADMVPKEPEAEQKK